MSDLERVSPPVPPGYSVEYSPQTHCYRVTELHTGRVLVVTAEFLYALDRGEVDPRALEAS